MQSSQRTLPHCINNSTIIINNYFIKNEIVIRKDEPKKLKKINEFKLTDEKIAKQYNKYLRKYDALGRDKLTQQNFHIVSKLTWLLGRLLARYNPLHFQQHFGFQREKKLNVNISCALHESENESYLLFDICGNKNGKYENAINRFVNHIQHDKDNPLVQEFYQSLKESNFSAALITRVSDHHREWLYLGPRYCAEKSLYIGVEKTLQHSDKNIKVSVANFAIIVRIGMNGFFLSLFQPQSSCKHCEHDNKVKGHYLAKNSKIVHDDKGNEKVVCQNSHKLNTPGNLLKRKLSKPRVKILALPTNPNNISSNVTSEINDMPCNLPFDPIPEIKEKIKDLPSSTLTDEIRELTQVVSKFTIQLSLFNKYHTKKPQPDITQPGITKEKSTDNMNVAQALGGLTTVCKRYLRL